MSVLKDKRSFHVCDQADTNAKHFSSDFTQRGLKTNEIKQVSHWPTGHNMLPKSSESFSHLQREEDGESKSIIKFTTRKAWRKRTFTINDKIKELECLLPDRISVSCGVKSLILQQAIDYIKKLKRKEDQLKRLEEKLENCDLTVKTVTERLEILETFIEEQGPSLESITENNKQHENIKAKQTRHARRGSYNAVIKNNMLRRTRSLPDITVLY